MHTVFCLLMFLFPRHLCHTLQSVRLLRNYQINRYGLSYVFISDPCSLACEPEIRHDLRHAFSNESINLNMKENVPKSWREHTGVFEFHDMPKVSQTIHISFWDRARHYFRGAFDCERSIDASQISRSLWELNFKWFVPYGAQFRCQFRIFLLSIENAIVAATRISD